MVTIGQVRTAIADRPQIYPSPTNDPEIIGYADGETTIFTLSFESFVPGSLTIYTGALPSSNSGDATVFTAVAPSQYTVGVPVSTSSETAVLAPGLVTITPASMSGIVAGATLDFDTGTAAAETITVESVTTSSFTANFANPHPTGALIANDLAGPLATTLATNAVITFDEAPDAGLVVAARYQATAFSDDDLSAYLARNAAKYFDDQTVLKGCQFDIIDAILMDQRRLEMLAQGDFRRDKSAYAAGLRALKESLRKDLAGDPQPGAKEAWFGVVRSTAPRYQPRR